MQNTLQGLGIVCVIAAIVGGGLKAFGIEFAALRSLSRQVLLASFGFALIGASVFTGKDPTKPTTSRSADVNPNSESRDQSSKAGTTPLAKSNGNAQRASVGDSEYVAQFESDKTNELQLARDGETAFARNDYDWAVKFLTQAKKVQTSGVWQSSYPFLYGAQLAGGNSSDAAKTRTEMLDAVQVAVNSGHSYLSHQTPIGFLLSNLGTVQRDLGNEHRPDFDLLIDQITELKQRATP